MMSMKLTSYAICGTGLVRTQNQDNLYINGVFRENVTDNATFRYADNCRDRGLYAVTDGMGGEEHGEIAALITVQAMNSIDISAGCQGIVNYIFERNAVICDLIRENGGARIGATFAGLSINDNRADIVNIGDSRIYLFRDGELKQLSLDHSLTRQMIEFGIMTEDVARKHPDRHKLTQHIGIFPYEMIIEPYSVCIDLKDGDIFLLCSDGLTDMLIDAEIESILVMMETIEKKSEALFEKAMKNGGKDNITVLLIQATASIIDHNM